MIDFTCPFKPLATPTAPLIRPQKCPNDQYITVQQHLWMSLVATVLALESNISLFTKHNNKWCTAPCKQSSQMSFIIIYNQVKVSCLLLNIVSSFFSQYLSAIIACVFVEECLVVSCHKHSGRLCLLIVRYCIFVGETLKIHASKFTNKLWDYPTT